MRCLAAPLLLLACSALRLQESARLVQMVPDVVPNYDDQRETNSPSWLPVRPLRLYFQLTPRSPVALYARTLVWCTTPLYPSLYLNLVSAPTASPLT